MTETKEQAEISNYVQANEGLVLVNSIAGSGKTTLLVEITKKLKPSSGLYLAYTKAVATSAQRKFPIGITCCTTHALAYRSVVKSHGLKLGNFNYRSIKQCTNYEDKQAVVNCLKEFCLSAYTNFEKYAKHKELSNNLTAAVRENLENMSIGVQECTHDFYLKLFHILYEKGDIKIRKEDIIMLDEAGDLNEVTLALFKLLPAKRKVMVGDPFQNIFTFNHTINCFEDFEGKSKIFEMTKSFRTCEKIAEKIQKFCRTHLDRNMNFQGVEIKDKTINTEAYIARTNVTLISKMLELNSRGIEYGLTRKAKLIFEAPLSLCNLKLNGFISDPSLRFVQEDVNTYFNSEQLQTLYKSPLYYIKEVHTKDIVIQQTIKTLLRHGQKAIIQCYKEAKNHEKTNQSYMLGTAHSTKGLEFDEVEIANDLNTTITGILKENGKIGVDSETELKLYYVACSRAKKSLIGALHLETKDTDGTSYEPTDNL